MQADVVTLDGGSAGSAELSDAIFGLEPRSDILQRVVRWQLAKRQAGTHKVKDRGEVSYSTKRIGRQKGGGTARHGSRRTGIFRKGGKSHGPVSRSHAHDLPKAIRRLGLKHALSSKAGNIVVLDSAALAEAKTKTLLGHLTALNALNALVIDGEIDTNFALASRNIPMVDVLPVAGLNVYDILRRDTLVVTKAGLDAIHARLADDTAEKEAA